MSARQQGINMHAVCARPLRCVLAGEEDEITLYAERTNVSVQHVRSDGGIRGRTGYMRYDDHASENWKPSRPFYQIIMDL